MADSQHVMSGDRLETHVYPFRGRTVPVVMMMVVMATVMGFSLFWGPLVLHQSVWVVKSDVWGSLRTAQFVSWGDIGDVYRSGGGLVTFPGVSLLLAPAALLIDVFRFSTAFPFGIPHPTAWLVLGPYISIAGSLVLLPLDALAEYIGLSRRRRIVLSITEAVALWPVIGIWGHPEDTLALAFALWGLLAAFERRWATVGWLFGLAMLMQPLVILMVPVVFAVMPRDRRLGLLVKSAVPSALILAIPLVQSWSATTYALLKQPNFPTLDHPTPWLALAPVISKSHWINLTHVHQVTTGDAGQFNIGTTRQFFGEVVAAGPGRAIALVLVMFLGLYARRARPNPEQLIWLCALALGLRCVFEAVMDPFYLWPPLALALVVGARSNWRLVMVVGTGALLSWWSYRDLGPWMWWAPVTLLLAVVLWSSRPRRPRTPVRSVLDRPLLGELAEV